jgi:hypothetical protein
MFNYENDRSSPDGDISDGAIRKERQLFMNDALIGTRSTNPLTAWRVHIWTAVLTLIAELIGKISIPIGVGTVVLLPLVWGMLLGGFVSLIYRRLPKSISLSSDEQWTSTAILQVAVLFFIAKLALMVGSYIPSLIHVGWALVFQEVGHFVGTSLIALPIAILLGIKREAIGATFSIGREPSLAIIAERYGMNSAEGRGVMAEYITGTVIGAIFISILASLLTSSHLFNPLALAMGAGVGSGSIMAAASGSIAAQQTANVAKQVAAFAAASNLITTTIGTYFTLFLSLPFANLLYRTLEPKIGRFVQARLNHAPSMAAILEENVSTPLPILIGLLAIVAVMCLVLGNWINYHTKPSDALLGMVIIVAVGAIGEVLKRVIPVRVPAVFWVTAIGMALTAPYWPGASWVAMETGKLNFLTLGTPVLTYAGLSIGKDIPTFRALGWRIVVVSLIANAGTFLFASVIAQFSMW